jgi:hypothetical protein
VLFTKTEEENNGIHTMIFSYRVDTLEMQANNILQYKTNHVHLNHVLDPYYPYLCLQNSTSKPIEILKHVHMAKRK